MTAIEDVRGTTTIPLQGEPARAAFSHGQQQEFSVVAIGASAGGLEACQKLLDALPPDTDMAFVFVQHLDPKQESLLAGLLARHTTMQVLDAADETPIEANHVYVIQPGMDLTVSDRRLKVAKASAMHAPRLPFDLLLESVAQAYGTRAVCVILSGTGADGSVGLRSISAKGGFVLAQEPREAGFDGMPESAIATGLVDKVLPVAQIARALINYNARQATEPSNIELPGPDAPLGAIIELLRLETGNDFTHYKTGTLQRRMERRMGMGSTRFVDLAAYLAHVKTDKSEREALAKDLLIHVTRFFRDPKTFAFLNDKIIPEIVTSALPDRPIRVWVAGCSTGEEAYSIAILFQEAIAAAKCTSKLQVFASDIDAEAITTARNGFYPHAISADVPADRLAAHFSKEDDGYRVAAELRSAIVFTTHNILADPPFSQLDFICCRNVLIYLGPDAQTRAIAAFHFALRDGGMLFLGTAETVGKDDGRFVAVELAQRIFRHVGRRRPGLFAFPNVSVAGAGASPATGTAKTASHASTIGDLSRQMLLDTYSPAAVVINHKSECLYTIGSVSRYLTLPQGAQTADILALARKTLRPRLRAAIHNAIQTDNHVRRSGGRKGEDGNVTSFKIDVTPFTSGSEKLLLVCFIEEASYGSPKDVTTSADLPRVERLQRELDEARTELQDAIRNLEVSGEEQKAFNDETLSVNEEYQSTNEELLTSKEELQSLNEELTALNSQLQETLENQRTTSNDLQNVLKSTDIATLFLDLDLKIRFFTPATRQLFNVIPSDIGRPLADLASLAADTNLP
ncbi:MAG: chemotaxis protein CheB, partial [Mesorhizobium sp.]